MSLVMRSLFVYRLIDQVGRVFANDPEDLGSIPGRDLKNGTWYLLA